ncbi:tRNA pseudouridine(55) synthase TruB [Corticibacter populi]|uniref:tRNA pseudouridine synthase B n=1 Tax=Corticibacter populi TaxID=1550736 RepID=A0A3M6R0Z8_9BURK|nr:tRNA pseudouridine(55) synthase TruB [Corticibacter populi]RMX08569.1 tRNA pseudouridine(55) synthase TruB [Corticibacter populi]RZS35891.1 tRNA pseudouridine synthase B [Corticibacter populi]
MTAPTRVRVQRRPVHGVLLLDKPLGLSSNQALQKAKWLLRAEKAGHTGTLDPLASGILPLCFGAATKFSQLQLEADKTYETRVRLGVTTSTADAEGEVLRERPVACTVGQLVQVLDDFTGPIAQVPPMHSALKKDGKALYEYARDGETVERAARQVLIHDLELLGFELGGAEPFVDLRVRCSKGTYIRTLGEDIGEALGCGGHLTMLRRVETGNLHVAQAITLDQLEALDDAARLRMLHPVEILLHEHPRIVLPPDEAGRFLSGMRRRGDWPDAAAVAVFGEQPEALLGVAHVQQGELIADRLLSPPEIQQALLQFHEARAAVA